MPRSRSKAALSGADRSLSNLLILLATSAVLLVAVDLTDGGFANSMDRIDKNLKVALRDLGENMPHYTDYVEKGVYLSTNATFNPKAMAGLYNLTRRFIDLVVGKDILMEDLIVFDANGSQKINADVTAGQILKHYWGLLTVVLLLAVVTVFLPVCGLLFCCCRCCGNCGSRPEPCDKKRDLCGKVVQGAMLILLGTAMLFCVVCAFATNQQLQDGVDEFTENIKISKNDTITYLDSAQRQINNLCDTNYKDFAVVFNKTISDSGLHVMQQLSIWSNATAMLDLYTFINSTVPNIQENLKILKNDTNSLRASASQLNDAVRKVKKDLLQTLQQCTLDECNKIRSEISILQTNIDFNKLPDVKPTIEKLNAFKFEEMKEAAGKGKDQLDDVQKEIEIKLNESLQNAMSQVNNAGVTIKQYVKDVNVVISDVQKEINKLNSGIEDVNGYLKEYGPYRYYGSLAISCVLLLVTVCISLGLICGICGKRPDGQGDNCCNKGAGSQFLICGVMLMFLSSVLIGVVTLSALLLGLTADRTVCDALRRPNDSSFMVYLDKFNEQQMSNSDMNVRVKDILERCYNNESIYFVLDLKEKFDLDEIKQKFDVKKFLNEMNSELDKINLKFTILNSTSEDRLRELSKINTINFDQFQDELNGDFLTVSLTNISSELEKLIVKIENVQPSLVGDIRLSILHINTYDERILVPMKAKAKKAIDIAKALDSELKMNSTSFQEAIEKMLEEIKDAQEQLQTKGTQILQDAVNNFSKVIEKQVNSYLDRVTNVTENELGQCGPMNVAINATLVATCDKIILPWNGFSFTLLITLLLFIPTIIVSVELASLYQKHKQYRPYVETEYLYDAYADSGVNIPLNSRGGKRGGKKKKGKKSDDRTQNLRGEVVAREYTAAAHPSDSRYADMAPKNWEEFPNGGPPQYQRAPTEYERPPPYYYPGTADQ